MVAETAGNLVPTATGTRLLSTWNMPLRGPLRPLSRVVARGMSKAIARSIKYSKADVEQAVERSET